MRALLIPVCFVSQASTESPSRRLEESAGMFSLMRPRIECRKAYSIYFTSPPVKRKASGRRERFLFVVFLFGHVGLYHVVQREDRERHPHRRRGAGADLEDREARDAA